MSFINVYLDDVRTPPNGWFLVKTAAEAIEMLSTNKVLKISLDHDLGEEKNGSGMDVIKYIEERAYTEKGYFIPEIIIHTANPVARQMMEMAARNIEKVR